jgi:NADP-dependent 3-hydroxy acid dehydrogenase YdfG
MFRVVPVGFDRLDGRLHFSRNLLHSVQLSDKERNVRDIRGKVAWVTGAGTGIGEAGAIALANAGAIVVLTGRRVGPLDEVAARIARDGGNAIVKPVDLTQWPAVETAVNEIKTELGRVDILVNNAGVNLPDRTWARLKPEGIDALIQGNLTSAIYCSRAVLPIMREQGDGQLIHTSSMAGRFISPVSGPIYTAAKHGVVAMSHTLNLEECENGIRSTVVCPGDVATPIMEKRDPPELPETMARMVQPEDMGSVIVFLASQPPHVCVNEILVTPTHNRGYIAQMKGRQAQQEATRQGS